MNHAILIDDGICVRSEGALESEVRIQFAILIKVDDAQLIGWADSPSSRLDVTADQADQRGFTTAVRTDQANARSRLDHQMNACKQTPIGNDEFQVFDLN